MSLELTIAGESLLLLPERALYWPRKRILIVADLHLGKGSVLRRAGVAVPRGASRDDLASLGTLLLRTGAQRLLVLGDFFHAAPPEDDPVLTDLEAFRARHPDLAVEILRGNHDRGVGPLPAHWQFSWHNGSQLEAPFVFSHHPEPDPRGYLLSGHLHPVLRLGDGRDSVRLPVFWFSPRRRCGVLPSFGRLTGGYAVQPAPDDQLVAITPDGLIALPPGSGARPRSRGGSRRFHHS